MNNSVKQILITKRACVKALGIEDAYKKNGNLKVKALKTIQVKLIDWLVSKEIVTNKQVKSNGVSVIEPEFRNCIKILFDWDRMAFDRNSNYHNVYYFDSCFIHDKFNLEVTNELYSIFGITNIDICND